MSKGFGFNEFALGLVAGIGLTINVLAWHSVGWGLGKLDETTPKADSYAAEQCARYQEWHATAQMPILDGEQPAPTKESPNDQKQGDNQDPDWCDLAAQQSMAESTRGMEWATWLVSALTALGVYLIYRTLLYTRRTLDEARATTRVALKANEAAEKTAETAADGNKIMREIGMIEMRAYIHWGEIWGIFDGKILKIFQIFRNTGQTATRELTLTFAPIYTIGHQLDFPKTRSAKTIFPSDFGPGDEREIMLHHDQPPNILPGSTSENAPLMVSVIIEARFEDVFGIEVRSRMEYWGSAPPGKHLERIEMIRRLPTHPN